MKLLIKKITYVLISMMLLMFIVSCTSVSVKDRMSEGERLYRSKCTVCHNLIPPSKFPFEKWNEYVEKYGKGLTLQEKESIKNYLKGHSK